MNLSRQKGRCTWGRRSYPFIFIDGEGLAGLLLQQFSTEFDGDYHYLGRVRVSVERLEEE
jgi:hypothetical protein